MNAPQLPHLMHPEEVAIRYGIKPEVLAKWRLQHKGPPFIRINQRRVMYRLQDVLQWEQDHAGK